MQQKINKIMKGRPIGKESDPLAESCQAGLKE
jgi:hypothetical protein